MVINVGLIGAGNSAKNISTLLLTMTETAILVALSDTQMDEVNKIHEVMEFLMKWYLRITMIY